MLDERKTAILRAIVHEYIARRSPSVPRTSPRHRASTSDSATVRNEMAVLEQEGYLVQPHTSAGRIPTDKGYRLFVDTLAAPGPLDTNTSQRVGEFFDAHGRRREMLHQTSNLLLDSPTTSLVVGPAHGRSVIRSVQGDPGRQPHDLHRTDDHCAGPTTKHGVVGGRYLVQHLTEPAVGGVEELAHPLASVGVGQAARVSAEQSVARPVDGVQPAADSCSTPPSPLRTVAELTLAPGPGDVRRARRAAPWRCTRAPKKHVRPTCQPALVRPLVAVSAGLASSEPQRLPPTQHLIAFHGVINDHCTGSQRGL